MDTLEFIMAYESGDLESFDEAIDGFAELIKSGMINHLQGSYGRMAAELIESGYIDAEGNVLTYE